MADKQPEYTGGSVSYYKIKVNNPTSNTDAYTAECNDIIESLGMTFAEGEAFKAIWRMAAARLGLTKKSYTDALYDAEKVKFFGERLVSIAKHKQAIPPMPMPPFIGDPYDDANLTRT